MSIAAVMEKSIVSADNCHGVLQTGKFYFQDLYSSDLAGFFLNGREELFQFPDDPGRITFHEQ